MTKRYALASAFLLLFTGAFAQERIADTRNCGSMEVLERQLQENPEMRKRLERLDQFSLSSEKRIITGQTTNAAETTVTIPVVVHVVWRTNDQNVSDAQIAAQIQVLNEDFNKYNSDAFKVPASFAGVHANTNIQFCLAAVTRTKTKKVSFSTNDWIKYTSKGGKDAWNRDQYLNFWVGNLSNGLLGYAQFPGGPAATDGVVCLFSSLPGGSANNYNMGRTATHEVGHWLNLRHIWGDATCGNDLVHDTPVHNAANNGCPAAGHLSTCAGTPEEMWMNYMDYTYDRCMYMFTQGQSTRMHNVFASGQPRYKIAYNNPVSCSSGGRLAVSEQDNRLPLLYPNPVTNELNIAFHVADISADVSFEIYNTMGQFVGCIYLGEQTQGKHDYQVNLDRQFGSIANGAYICLVKTGASQRAIRFMVAK